MTKLAIVFLVGGLVGYTVGYREAAEGSPSLKERMLTKVGVYKVRDEQRERQRVIDEVQRSHADSIESAIHRASPPR